MEDHVRNGRVLLRKQESRTAGHRRVRRAVREADHSYLDWRIFAVQEGHVRRRHLCGRGYPGDVDAHAADAAAGRGETLGAAAPHARRDPQVPSGGGGIGDFRVHGDDARLRPRRRHQYDNGHKNRPLHDALLACQMPFCRDARAAGPAGGAHEIGVKGEQLALGLSAWGRELRRSEPRPCPVGCSFTAPTERRKQQPVYRPAGESQGKKLTARDP